MTGTRDMIENQTFAEIAIGQSATLSRRLGQREIQLFALATGDVNPTHMDPAYAASDAFHQVVAHGLWSGGLISAVLGNQLPGPGAVYVSQSLNFVRPVVLGDVVTARVTVTGKDAADGTVTLACLCVNQHGEVVVEGEARVRAPAEKVSRARFELPDVSLADHGGYHRLIVMAHGHPPMPTAVVHPCSGAALSAAVEAAQEALIAPILIGPEAKIRAAAQEAGLDISAFRLVAVPHSHAAAAEAVAMVGRGEAGLLMKGSRHTDELMGAVLAHGSPLRTGRRISHVYLMDVPGYPHPLLVTDAAINIAPSLEDKADIIRNAIDLAHVIGIACPRVAILAAVETVTASMPATLDAAALCKMAERGQITGGILDGPLAFDNAISRAAAAEKKIVSPVAGRAQILVVPNIEAGNMLAKQLTFLGGADAAGIVLGARVPIILTSRADSLRTRLASCAVGLLLAAAREAGANGTGDAAANAAGSEGR